jgi:hypothetical protein
VNLSSPTANFCGAHHRKRLNRISIPHSTSHFPRWRVLDHFRQESNGIIETFHLPISTASTDGAYAASLNLPITPPDSGPQNTCDLSLRATLDSRHGYYESGNLRLGIPEQRRDAYDIRMSIAPAPLQTSISPSIPDQEISKKMGGSAAGGGISATPSTSSKRDYKGFVAGVFSGIAKLSGMVPVPRF